MSEITITGHVVVKNEDRFISLALRSVLPFLDKILVYDTGSRDKTIEIIKAIKSPKIIFEERGEVTPAKLVELRREQIEKTRTDFFFILDGDEIWPERNIKIFVDGLEQMPKEKVAAFCRTRNAVGDVYHYLSEDAGRYHLAGIKGHLNIRAYRNVPGISVEGTYPLEYYTYQGRKLNNWDAKLYFIGTWYWHGTNLVRSSSGQAVTNRKQNKYELGISFSKEELPEILLGQPRRDFWYLAPAALETPLRRLKRWLLRNI